MPQISGPCLLADGVILASSLDVVAPELVLALDPMPDDRQVEGLVGRHGSGRSVTAGLDRTGLTPAIARSELALTLELAQFAHAALPERTRRRLAWPPLAERLTADLWLVAYAAEPARWLLDMAGGLTPTVLLRCCMLARPLSAVELWITPDVDCRTRVHSVQPSPAPMAARSARSLLRAETQPMQQPGQQP
ncbi:hypothetical protein [Granulicoccus sp. GXG6511]|uniref:hypothetical protein n=1 Tax=Granulicoccus sp. GXG6511 TaxID=3381351 RepID=UPI003D7CF39A